MTDNCCDKSDQACEVTKESYLVQIGHNLPRGSVWGLQEDKTFSKFWEAIAQVLADTNNYLCSLVSELFPCTATCTIDRWGELFRMPIECLPHLTDEDKQDLFCFVMELINGGCRPGTLGFIQAIIDNDPYLLGITITEHQTPPAGNAGCFQAGCSFSGRGRCSNYLTVNVPDGHPALVEVCTGCPDEVCEMRVPEVDCLIEMFSPYNIAYLVEIEPPVPVFAPLVEKMVSLGATEVWLMDDVSGNAVALYDSDHDLILTDGNNVSYEYPFSSFVGLKGIDASSPTGDATYFETAAAVPDLQTIGDITEVEVGIATAALSDTYAPTSGVTANGSGSANNDNFGYSAYLNFFGSLAIQASHQYGSGTVFKNGTEVLPLTYDAGGEFVSAVVRDSSNEDYLCYINGEHSGTISYSGLPPTGGADGKYAVGRNLRLGSAIRPGRIYSVRALFKDIMLTESDIVEIQASAFDFGTRFGELPLRTRNNVSLAVGGLSHRTIFQYSKTANVNVLPTTVLAVGEYLFFAQLNSGTMTVVTGGYSIIGDATSYGIGDIMKVERTGVSEITITHA